MPAEDDGAGLGLLLLLLLLLRGRGGGVGGRGRVVHQGGPAGPLARVLIGGGLVEVAGNRQGKKML